MFKIKKYNIKCIIIEMRTGCTITFGNRKTDETLSLI